MAPKIVQIPALLKRTEKNIDDRDLPVPCSCEETT